MMNQVIRTPLGYNILFGYNPRLLQQVKMLPGRSYTPSGGWFVPLSSKEAVERFALRNGFHMDGLDRWEEEPFDYRVEPMRPLDRKIELKRDLFPFQEEGVQYILDHPRCIVGDKPGLGKTAQAIAAVVATGAFPCLVVCPSTLKYNWKAEIEEKWTDCKAEILDARIERTWPFLYQCGMAQFFIVNYESLKRYFVAGISPSKKGLRGNEKFKLKDVRFRKEIQLFRTLIVDEAHRCKDTATQQAKLVRGLSIGKENVYLLTGTPVVNKPDDLVSLLGILDMIRNSSSFGNISQFKSRFCQTDRNWERLQTLLRNHCYYSREKKDVLKQLPDKVRTVVKCDITTRTEYRAAMADLEGYLVRYRHATDEQVQRSMRGEVMVRIGVLKNIAAWGKLAAVQEHVSDIIDSGEKIILFVNLKEVASALKTVFPGSATILGEDTAEEREEAVRRFQEDPGTRVIICSIKAAGVGLTLTAAHTVGFVELPWHGADCEQCEDRAHRIGQKDSVECVYYLGKDTIDEWIYEVIREKMDMAGKITGGHAEVRTSVLDSLVELLSGRKEEPCTS